MPLKMNSKSILAVLLVLGISAALIVVAISLSLGRAPSKKSVAGASGVEPQGMIIDLGIPVNFVDANGDGAVESLKNAASGEIVYTFSSPISLQGGKAIKLDGNITLSGTSIPVAPGTMLLVN